MIVPPGQDGVLFGTSTEADARTSVEARHQFVAHGAPDAFAYLHQVHGADVVEATAPGLIADADAVFTRTPGLSLTIATADCVPIVVHGSGFVAAIHAGWRGAAAEVVASTLDRLTSEGLEPTRAAIGPAIGACCYEVSDDVTSVLTEVIGTTTWGTSSVDLVEHAARSLGHIDVWRSGVCTHDDADMFSYRRDGTPGRQTAVAWITM